MKLSSKLNLMYFNWTFKKIINADNCAVSDGAVGKIMSFSKKICLDSLYNKLSAYVQWFVTTIQSQLLVKAIHCWTAGQQNLTEDPHSYPQIGIFLACSSVIFSPHLKM